MAEVIMGSSGFKYEVTYQSGGGKASMTCIVKNVKTNAHAFTLKPVTIKSDHYKPVTQTKTFLGFDERYYHIIVRTGFTHYVKWGQVQSDGAVIQTDRTILTRIPFYPLYIKTAPVVVPSMQPVVDPAVSVIPVTPEIKGFKEAKKYYLPKEEISWLKKIIKKIKTWIIKMLNL